MVTVRPTQNPGFSHHPGASTETQFCILELMNSHFKSKIRSILFLSIATLFISCEDEGGFKDSNGTYYFDSITELDLESKNDCSLPPCSKDRIKRLHFNEVYGYLQGEGIIVTIDRYHHYYLEICNPQLIDFSIPSYPLPSIIFTGTARDGCGFLGFHEIDYIEFSA